MYREDYLLRFVKQLAAALARVAGLRKSGEHEQALQEIQETWDELLGMPPGLFESMSADALTAILGSPEKARAVASLLHEEAAVLRTLGRSEAAERKERLAKELGATTKTTS
ncbi:MAG: hypothetical protein HY698_21755 [Deltaproteobacteria bacterium]|nr:hypothetical protein [Deltaproteobacteria bacterium]